MATQTEHQKKWKANHIKALEALGFKASQFNRLRQLENIANYNAASYCNGWIDGDTYEYCKERTIKAVTKLHSGALPAGFFVNGDPRGYALKIDNEKVEIPQGMHTDWGGYGILAPVF